MGRKKDDGMLDISELIAAPILIAENDEHMWTGLVRPENVTQHIIHNKSLREEFINLTRAIEKDTKEYRELHRQIKNKVFSINSEQQLNERIVEIGKQLISNITLIKEWLRVHGEQDIDVGLFGVMLCREYEEILEKKPEEFKSMDPKQRKLLERFRTGFADMEPCIRELYMSKNNYYTCHQFLTQGQYRKYYRHGKENGNSLVDVLEHVSGHSDMKATEGTELIKEIFGVLELSDLKEIFPNQIYADMQSISILKNYLLEKGFKPEEIDKMSTADVATMALKTYDTENENLHKEFITQTIIDGIEYLDLEKLLLIAMSRRLEHLEGNRGTLRIITNEHIEESKKAEELVKKILEMNIVSGKAKGKIKIAGEEIEVSLKRIEELMKNFCDGMYITDTLEQKLKIDAYFNPEEMSTWSDELISRFDYSDEDKEVISMVNFENLKRLYSLGKLNKQDIKNMLMKLSNGIENGIANFQVGYLSVDWTIANNVKDFFRNVFDEELISTEELSQYFEEGIVTQEMLETLEYNRTEQEAKALHEKLGQVFSQEMLLSKYRKYIEKHIEFMKLQANSPEETEKIEELRTIVNRLRNEKDICRELFKRYHSLTPEEKHKLGDSLLEKYYYDMEVEDDDVLQESIKVMYEDEMIDLENIITLDKQYIIPMLDSLSLDDASKVRKSMSFEKLEEMLDDIFDNPEISDERKFIIIMNVLGEDTEKDKELREFYLSMLKFDDSERKGKPKGKRNGTGLDISKTSNKYIYPDIVKWKFYKGLDKDVRVTRHSNGFVEFATSKLGVRIIEKYYEGSKPAYGTATYILSEQDYRRNQGELVTINPTGCILESATLREITPKKDRIAHRTHSTDRTWMDEIVKYFDINYEREDDSRYTVEELRTLQNTVKTLKNQYQMIK